MEQQKVLWIIFSVALFVLVIVGIGVIWFLPNDHQAAKAATAQKQTDSRVSFDPYEWAKSDNNAYPGLEGPQPSGQQNKDFTIIYGQNPQQPATAAGASTAAPAATEMRAVPGLTGGALQAAPRATPRPAARPAARPAPQNVRVAEHWIQAASYTSNFRAEQAKKLLDGKGITSRITSYDLNGTTYFRVRIGPYTNEQEAQHSLSQVKQVSGFENSFLTLVYATRSAQ